MKRDWKSGDVALVRSRVHPDTIPDEPRILSGAVVPRWYGMTGFIRDENAEIVRPLVVIDPEDHKQVGRLTRIYMKQDHDTVDEALQAALREFANPTPPKCGAYMSTCGDHYDCDRPKGHDNTHGNADGEAIWAGDDE